MNALSPGELAATAPYDDQTTSRMEILDGLFAHANLDVIGIQESRIQRDGMVSSANYNIFRASELPQLQRDVTAFRSGLHTLS